MSWALAGALMLAPIWAWKIGHRWPPSLRDNSLLTLGALVAVLLVPFCWPLAVLWSLALIHWDDPDRRPSPEFFPPITGVLAIGSIAGVFYLASRVPATELWMIRWAILATGLSQCVVLSWQGYELWKIRHTPGMTFHRVRDGLRGSMANRVVTGGLLAFCLALAPIPLMPLFGIAVLATNSFTALAASLVALVIRFPPDITSIGPTGLTISAGVPFLICLAAALIGVCSVAFWRGNPMDSSRGRRAIWALCLETWLDSPMLIKLLGEGHFAFSRHARWWQTRQAVKDEYRQAHCDILQLLLEYGVVGVLAVLVWVGMLARAFTPGDPWTAAAIVAMCVSLNQFTLHLPHTGLAAVAVAGVLWSRLG